MNIYKASEPVVKLGASFNESVFWKIGLGIVILSLVESLIFALLFKESPGAFGIAALAVQTLVAVILMFGLVSNPATEAGEYYFNDTPGLDNESTQATIEKSYGLKFIEKPAKSRNDAKPLSPESGLFTNKKGQINHCSVEYPKIKGQDAVNIEVSCTPLSKVKSLGE